MSWAKNAEYWRSLPVRSTVWFLAAVFCLFSAIGFVTATISADRPNGPAKLGFVFSSAVFATCWAFAGTRRLIKTMIVIAVTQFAVNAYLSRQMASGGAPITDLALMKHFIVFNGVTAIVSIVLGYILFLVFFRMEATRYYANMTEMRLAGEIHRSLVPEIATRCEEFEFYGNSWPSGQVSGDLVDVIEFSGGWFAYVADVSGHGVPAGVLMTMVKSAARTRLAAIGPVAFLEAMNEALQPLSAPNMYVTLAFVSYTGGAVEFATAGHVPILRLNRESSCVEEHSAPNFPIAMLRDVPFQVSTIPCRRGDVLAIVTDGLTEIADEADGELGLEPLRAELLRNADAPLSQLGQKLRARALRHGKQTDDQAVLIVRRR